MEAVYTALSEKPFDSFYAFVQSTIDATVQDVWPYAVDIEAWMTDHQLVTVSGHPRAVGYFQRCFPCDLDKHIPEPRYQLYGIANIIPLKLISLEVFPERGGSYGNARPWMSFDHIILDDLGAKCRISFLMTNVHMGQGDDAFRRRQQADIDGVGERVERYFDNLKRLVGVLP